MNLTLCRTGFVGTLGVAAAEPERPCHPAHSQSRLDATYLPRLKSPQLDDANCHGSRGERRDAFYEP
jgi:hypothetical protein